MRSTFGRSSLIASLLCLGLLPQQGVAQQRTQVPPEFTQWLPLTDAERDQKGPLVDKTAGAEVLLWRVHVVDELLGDNRSFQRVFYHYIRLKIFDDSGKEKAATIDLPYREPGGVIDVSGHTIKADGSVVDLDRKTVYKRVVERVGGFKESVVSFAMPGVDKGAILEYRWKQTEDDNRFRYVRLMFQRELPVERVTYFVKPLDSQFVVNEQLYLAPFNCTPSPIKLERDGYNSTTLENVAAAKSEPFTPTNPNIQPWALLYYREGGMKEPNKYWDEQGKALYKSFKEEVKNDGETKAAAANAVGAAADENTKLVALAAFVRGAVRNISDNRVTTAEREAYFKSLPRDRRRTSTEVLRGGLGTSREMNLVLGALAAQAGFDVRPAMIADRSEIIFNPKLAERYFLDNEGVAIRSGNAWKIVDISDKHVPPGMLPWHEEGMLALVGDAKAPSFSSAGYALADTSVVNRTAKLELMRDGSIAGNVDETYTGHEAEQYRREIGTMSGAQREQELHDRVTKMFPDAEVNAIKLENVDDSAKPLVAHYHLEAPRFAQVTGKRILLQPNAFRRGQRSPFSAAQRTYPIEFPYGWKEVDNITILLPMGLVLDNADVPSSLNFGKPGGYDVKIQAVKGDRPELRYTRTFSFGNEGAISFDASSYGAVKKAFDTVQVRDTHTISLKEE